MNTIFLGNDVQFKFSWSGGGRLNAAFASRVRGKAPIMWIYSPMFNASAEERSREPFQRRDVNGSLSSLFNIPGVEKHHLDKDRDLAVDPDPGDWLMPKRGYSPFTNPHFDPFLRERGISRILVGGYEQDCCVNALVKNGLSYGYDITVFIDLIARGDISAIKIDNLLQTPPEHWGPDEWKIIEACPHLNSHRLRTEWMRLDVEPINGRRAQLMFVEQFDFDSL